VFVSAAGRDVGRDRTRMKTGARSACLFVVNIPTAGPQIEANLEPGLHMPQTHKGFVYYRCQVRKCATTAIREESADQSFLERFLCLRLSGDEQKYCGQEVQQLKADRILIRKALSTASNFNLARLTERLNRLTDAYIDRLIEKDVFEQRKVALKVERLQTAEALASWRAANAVPPMN
jgi:hypothetical protein